MGKKTKFVYNPKTLQYEEEKLTLKKSLFKFSAFAMIVVAVATILTYFAFKTIPSPETKALERELVQMERKYMTLNEKIGVVSKVIDNVKQRDENVYKMLFGMEPIDNGLWEGGIGGHDIFTNVTDYSNRSNLIKATDQKLSQLERKIVLQSKSIEEAEDFAIEREDKLSSIPSIKPVRKTTLARNIQLLSGFGMRMHPIHKVKKMHQGLDFTCPQGTEIYATGDGVVKEVRASKTGYGLHIKIDHGYGYTTLYAHMSETSVKKGQEVKKGEAIGRVGNTGTSTAAHLHYEVRIDNVPVNPINYVLDGLEPAEYAELVKQSKVANQSFD